MGNRHRTGDDQKRAHVVPTATGSLSELDSVVQRYEEGDAWQPDDEVVELTARRPLDKVIPVRLTAEQWRDMGSQARELGIGPTTLARMWIVERLHKPHQQGGKVS